MSTDRISELVNEVFLASAALTRTGDRLAAPQGLTAARWLVLGALQDGPLTMSEIGRRRGLSRQSARESVERLERAGLVVRAGNPLDRRAPLLDLTEAGRDALTAIEPRRAAWAASLARDLDPDEIRIATRLLRELRELRSEPTPDRVPTPPAFGAASSSGPAAP
ncbi:MarR family winged helix-turn-helix transcriptional regulator [Agromyces sp. MMS24-JH15]|uniref:MarR family winged helix-turn-helix transcriptional regulator n=1 Tax=Agromyces sp. MMS24-JH15 TaxID=3243765 RepID=UPI00374A6146